MSQLKKPKQVISRVLSRIVIYLGPTLLRDSSELLFIRQKRTLLLHQAGFTTSLRFHRMRGVLLPHFSPLPRFRRLPLKRRSIVSVALSLFSRTVGVTHCPFDGARTFLPDSKMNQSDYLTYLGYFDTIINKNPCQIKKR